MQEIDSAHARCTATERTESVTAWNSLKRSCNSVSQETNAIKACLMSFRNFMNVMWLQCDCYIDCLYIKNVVARWHRKKLISCSVDVFGKHASLRCADFGKEFEGISAKAATCRPPLWPQTVYIRPNPSESILTGLTETLWPSHLRADWDRLRLSFGRVRRTGIVSANSTDLPCINFEPDDLDISPVIRCLLYFIMILPFLLKCCCFQVFDGSRMRPSQRARAVPCLKTQQKDAMAFVPTSSTRVRRGKLPGDPDHYNSILRICFVCFRYSTVILLYIVHSSWMFIANLMNSAVDGLKGIDK